MVSLTVWFLLRTRQCSPTSGRSRVIRFRRTQLLFSRSNNDDSNNLNFIYRDSCVTPSSNSDDRRWRQFIWEKWEVKQEQHKKYAFLILFTRSEYFIFAIIVYPLFYQISRILEIWTLDQDEKLKELVAEHGMGWTKIGELFGERNGKQCRERWYNHLDPAVNKGEWTLEVWRVECDSFYLFRDCFMPLWDEDNWPTHKSFAMFAKLTGRWGAV